MIEDYFDQTIALINESKLPKDRKFKILANLQNMILDYYVHRRIRLIIDEKGFDYFLQKIKAEEVKAEEELANV